MKRFAKAYILFFITLVLPLAGTAAGQIQVTTATPNAAAQGTVNLDVTVSGKGFKRGARAQWFVKGSTNPGGVQVNSTAFVNSTTLTANITVADTADISTFDIQVENSDGRIGKGTELFSVVAKGTSTGGGQCTDAGVSVVFAPFNNGANRIYADGARLYDNPSDSVFHGGSVYTDDLDRITAKFQTCNGTNDLIINVYGTTRYFNFDFTEQLVVGDPSVPNMAGKTIRENFFNINQVANDALYIGGQLETCLGTSLSSIIKGNTSHLYFNHSSLRPGGANPVDCADGSGILVASIGGEMAKVRVLRTGPCTWEITPVADLGVPARGGLAIQKKGGSIVAGGQYNMPFAMKVTKLLCP